MPVCQKCSQEKSVDDFYDYPRNRSGKSHRCKSCAVGASRTSYLRHRERVRKRNHDSLPRLKVRRLKRLADGKCSACRNDRMTSSNWYCKKHWFAQAANANLGTTKHGAGLIKIYEAQNRQCPYTGKCIEPGNMELDHKYPKSRFPELAGSIENVEWVSPEINQAKGDMTVEEFTALCRLVVERETART